MQIGSEHLHARRKRKVRTLAPYPHPNALRRKVDMLMLIVGPLAPLALLPQVLEVYNTQDASAFSLLTWGAFSAINLLWVWYGVLHSAKAILVANGGLFVLNMAIVVGILVF